MEQKKLRVLEILDSYYPNVDGTIELINNYAKCLNNKEGVECEIVVPKYPRTNVEQPFKVNYSVSMSGCGFGVRLPLPFLDYKLNRYLNENDFDLIHAHSPVTLARYAMHYAHKHRIPILFTMHTKFHEEINRSVPIRFLQKFALSFVMYAIRRMDYVYAVSQGAADCLRDYGYKGEIGILKNGTDLVYPEKDMSAEIAEIRNKYELDKAEHVFLFVGRIVVVKKIQNLLRVAKELKIRGMSFKLLIVGDGDYLKPLKKLTAELGVEDVVVFTGKILDREKLSAYYLASDLFLFPSTFDTFGLVALEAAALKLPSLLVKGCAAAELVEDGRNGFVAEETTEAWADKIETIMSDKAALAEVRENCCREVYRTWDQATDEALSVYRDCIEDYKKNKCGKKKTKPSTIV